MTSNRKPSGVLKYVFGGLSGMAATCFVQPFDLVKTRMQVSGAGGAPKEYRNAFHAFTKIVEKEGLGIYKGLDAGLLRQATYTTTRLGIYTHLNDLYKEMFEKTPNLLGSMAMGMIAGGCGAFVGTPAEVALIRLTTDGRLPPAERRNYTGAINAMGQILREEGITALWKGTIPTVSRAMVVNMAQLASYTQAKQKLLSSGYFHEGILLHFTASMLSGLVTTTASMPVDMAKTRIQQQHAGADGKMQYTGTLDVLAKVIRQEGFFALWRGFAPYFARLGPHTVLTFIFLEQLNAAYTRFASK